MDEIVEDATQSGPSLEEVYRELDSVYYLGESDITPAERYARQNDVDMEVVIEGYVNRVLEEDHNLETSLVDKPFVPASQVARNILGDYLELVDAFDLTPDAELKDVHRGLSGA